MSARLVSLFVWGLLTLCGVQTAGAVDPTRTLSQYVRQKWTSENGFPRGPVYSISQTSDGYLWIGTESGLIRFDGLRFRVIQSKDPELPPLTHVLGLIADPDGSLWVRLRRPTLLRLNDGEFKDAMSQFGRPDATASAMSLSSSGSLLVWALQREAAAIMLRNGRFETVAAPSDFSRSPVLALAQTEDGDIWVGTRDAGLFRISGGRTIQITSGLPDMKVNALAKAGRNQLWVGTDRGVVRWDGAGLTSVGVPSALANIQALTLLVDRDANLWVGANSRGLARVNATSVSWWDDGLKGADDVTEAITALFEDREGNLWVGSGHGIERIRDSPFVTYSRSEGIPSDTNGPVYADPKGRLWFAPLQGGLWWLRDGTPTRLTLAGLTDDVIYSLAGGRDGLWIGRQRGGLTLLRWAGESFAPVTYTMARGLAQNSVYSVYESRDGSVWAGTLSGGVSRLNQDRFTTYTSDAGLASNTVAAIAEGSEGTIWFATPSGLSALKDGRWRTFGAKDGLPSDNINSLLVDAGGVLWIGTASGLAFWNSGAIRRPAQMPASLREQILGMAEDRNGLLWIATSGHVVRVNRAKLIRDALAEEDVREFTITDGLRGTEGVKRSRTVVSDDAGHLWFSMSRGISLIDPTRLKTNSAPAIVHVETLSTDGNAINIRDSIHVGGGGKRLTLGFSGLSLSVPEQVRFRYRLEGFEDDWNGPVTAREAVYTNLAPRTYRFRVVASNPDGVWNKSEGTLAFTIDPMFWQTWWFQLAIALACGLTALLLYRLRLHRLTRRLNLRFEERLAERTRIAQELHDTLLQGFLSTSMQLHLVADSLPEDSSLKPTLTRTLQRMRQVIEEGRNAVRGLRSSNSASLDLEQAFSLVPQELGSVETENVHFRVIVDGQQRPLHPLLRDEVYRIGREALINAFRHSRASDIEIELKYSPTQFRISVRDDGSGIDPVVLVAGRDGHWGLSGMRERADRIGARLHVFTRASAGTEVELTVPGHLAFQDQSTHRWKWFGRRGNKNGH